MSILRRRWLSVLLIALLAGVLLPSAASAASGRTVYVDNSGAPNAAGKGKCGKPNYNKIQAAVDDLSASRVVVCKGTYTEQVAVTRGLTLQGRSGAVIQAPAVLGASGSIVSFDGPQQSRLRGFTIKGSSTTEQTGVGVRLEGGARVTISHNRIRDIGEGIVISHAQADITDNTIEHYGYVGIVASGTGAFAQIDDNTIRGQGADADKDQIGIYIHRDWAEAYGWATADIEDNTISGNYTTDPERDGYAIDVNGANASIRDNTLTDNFRGIILVSEATTGGSEVRGSEVRSNVIRDNVLQGVFLHGSSHNTIVENEISHNGEGGILLIYAEDESSSHNLIATNKVHDNGEYGIFFSNSIENTVKENRVFDNGNTDITDNSTPLGNTYSDNRCDTSNPDGLCED